MNSGLEMVDLTTCPHLLAWTHTFYLCSQHSSVSTDKTWHVNPQHARIFQMTVPLFPFSITPFSSVSSLSPCLPELDSDGWLHSKVGRPMVLSLRVNQKVSYPFLPTAHLCTDILACFSPRRRQDKMFAPREETVCAHTQTHTQTFTLIPQCQLNPT